MSFLQVNDKSSEYLADTYPCSTLTSYLDASCRPIHRAVNELVADANKEAGITRSDASFFRQEPPFRATVLLVDDDELIREALSELLALCGFQAIVASSGQQGLGLLDEYAETIDLILLDFLMPGMDGIETLAEIRTRYPETKVLLSSGFNRTFLDEMIIEDAYTDFIQKPYEIDKLIDKAERLLA